MQHAFQSKHSHSTPGISIYFHSLPLFHPLPKCSMTLQTLLKNMPSNSCPVLARNIFSLLGSLVILMSISMLVQSSLMRKLLTTVILAWVFACYCLNDLPFKSWLTSVYNATSLSTLCSQFPVMHVSLKQLHGYITYYRTRYSMSVLCKTSASHTLTADKRSILSPAKLKPMQPAVKLHGGCLPLFCSMSSLEMLLRS